LLILLISPRAFKFLGLMLALFLASSIHANI
jgi:hypothetical protein